MQTEQFDQLDSTIGASSFNIQASPAGTVVYDTQVFISLYNYISLYPPPRLSRLACQGCVFSVCFFPSALFPVGVYYCRCLILSGCTFNIKNVVKGPPHFPAVDPTCAPFWYQISASFSACIFYTFS